MFPDMSSYAKLNLLGRHYKRSKSVDNILQSSTVSRYRFKKKTIIHYQLLVHRCRPGGKMRACHAAGSGSIPGRDKFPG